MRKEPVASTRTAPDSAFTLIELLVVVAIVTSLLAVLLPALSTARRMADRIRCQGHLKQLAGAWKMYFDEHEGRLYRGENAESLYGGWRGTDHPDHPRPLNRHLGLPPLPSSEHEARMFRCFGDKGYDGPLYYQDMGTSYKMNILLIGDYQIASLPSLELWQKINARMLRLTAWNGGPHVPERVLLIGDYGWGDQWLPRYPPGPFWHDRRYYYNVAFLDTHVQFLRIRKGLYYTPEYTVLPFEDLWPLAKRDQEEESTP